MRVGFYSYWGLGDSSDLAIRLAERLLDLGIDISIFPTNRRPKPLHFALDKFVVRNSESFSSWARTGQFSHLIFGDMPSPEILKSISQPQDKFSSAPAETYLLCNWSDLNETDVRHLHKLTGVIAPAKAVAALLSKRVKLQNIRLLPWDAGVPVASRSDSISPSVIRLFWPVTVNQKLSADKDFTALLGRVLKAHPVVKLTVSCSGHAPSKLAEGFQHLHVVAGDRVKLLKDLTSEKEAVVCGQSDLTLWPSLIENTGLVGLTSLAMDTPVLAFAHPVIEEVVRDGLNGSLIPCVLNYNWLGVPRVEPDWTAFESWLTRLIARPELLTALRLTAHLRMVERRMKWLAGVDELFLTE
jgi:hypothetical protein